MENQTLVAQFWETYRVYVASYNEPSQKTALRPTLSSLLAQIEKPARKNIVHDKYPEHNILAWQVLRDQAFFDGKSGRSVLELCAGELLGWDIGYDRDIFLTRVPYREVVSGYTLNPGSKCLDENKDIYNDERGLYLPIYDPGVVMKIYNQETVKYKNLVLRYLEETKGVPPNKLMLY